MKIETKYFGEIEIEENLIINFDSGIPGFPDEKAFVLLPLEEDSPFQVMQSVKTAQVAFIITSPFIFFKDYEIKLSDQVIEQLQFKNEQDVVLYTILNIREPFKDSTANLVAPVLINIKRQIGKQIVLENAPYHTKHLIFQDNISDKKEDRHADPQEKAK